MGFQVRVAADTAQLTAELAAAAPAERVAVVDARFVGHLHSLRLALTDPRFPAAAVPGALTSQPEARSALLRALAQEPPGPADAVTSSAGAHRDASSASVSAEPFGRERETGVGHGRLAAPAGPAVPAPGSGGATGDSLPDRLAGRLTAEGVGVHRPELGTLVATVAVGAPEREAARAAVAAVDDERVRLRTAVKSRDGFFTTFCISPYSRYLARWCARRGLTPNQVTTASLLTALIAAGCAATGTRLGYVAAAVLLLGSFVLDCADGQLARYALRYSTLGAWLDATFDRAKEYAFYAGLALGAAHADDDVWALALAAMGVQICRHVVDFSFTEAHHDAVAHTSPTAALSARLDGVGWTVWLRRMIVLPIGERWALIAVLTALTTPRTVFVALLIGCAMAACYTTAGRVLRSITRKADRTDRATRALADLADNGPLAMVSARSRLRLPSPAAPLLALSGAAVLVSTAGLAPLGSPWPALAALVYALTSGLATAAPLRGALDWLVPPLFRAAEYLVVLLLAIRSEVNGALPAAFGLVAAVAYHHYDTVYRIRGGSGAPPRWLAWATAGQEGRVLLVTVAVALLSDSDTGFTIALTVLTVTLAFTVLVESVRFWMSSGAPAVHDETGEPA